MSTYIKRKAEDLMLLVKKKVEAELNKCEKLLKMNPTNEPQEKINIHESSP